MKNAHGRGCPLAFLLLALATLGSAHPARAQELALLPDSAVVTHHTVQIEGQEVRYTAEAGTLPLREDGKTMARMFYVYYTRDGVQDLGRRPLFISFNGGPGTASVWMHMGYTGPRRVAYDEEGFAKRPPVGLEDNPHSILDVADIVYIDPVATGFSRMVEGEDAHKYHGTMSDISAMAEFVRLFLLRKQRVQSPKFVIGESYGTTRASGLAGYLLSQHQIYVNGVILVSMTNLGLDRGPDVSYATSLPQKTAAAWYHKQLPADLQGRPLRDVLDEAEAFAVGDYLHALIMGDRLDDAARRDITERVARFTGLTPEYVQDANLRIDASRFWKELLRGQRLTIGRLDSRYTGINQDAAGENPDFDPAMANWNGPFRDAVDQYFRRELDYQTDVPYNIWGPVRPWKQDDVSVADMLGDAMRQNPYMKVLIQGGYFDAATDYYSAEYTISHIQPHGELADRFRFRLYESGHMMYLRKPDLANANNDLRDFVKWCLEDLPVYPYPVKPRRG